MSRRANAIYNRQRKNHLFMFTWFQNSDGGRRENVKKKKSWWNRADQLQLNQSGSRSGSRSGGRVIADHRLFDYYYTIPDDDSPILRGLPGPVGWRCTSNSTRKTKSEIRRREKKTNWFLHQKQFPQIVTLCYFLTFMLIWKEPAARESGKAFRVCRAVSSQCHCSTTTRSAWGQTV